MMYLSRIRLNPTRRGTRRLLASPQAMHAIVAGSHPPHDHSGEGRILWRLDQLNHHDLQLYVVSPTLPDFNGLIEQAGWPASATWDTTEYSPFLRRLQTGQQWRFRLTANPTRVLGRPGEGSGRGEVVPHKTVGHQRSWFEKNCQTWGFTVATNSLDVQALELSDRRTDTFRRAVDGGSTGGAAQRVAITRVSFTGVLEVADAETLRSALSQGMGRAKAYGCGLMTLARTGDD